MICGGVKAWRRRILRCPVCQRRTRHVVEVGVVWYAPIVQCVSCGDSWSEGELHPRPFRRGWREEAQRSARDRWQRAVSPGEADQLDRDELHAVLRAAS